MSKDYKYCLPQAQKQSQKPVVAGWQWLLASGLIIGFVIFLLSLRGKAPQAQSVTASAAKITAAASDETKKAASVPQQAPLKEEPPKPVELLKPAKPRFQFYTVLPGKEVIIPESEVKARRQEEKQGKAPLVGDIYMLQIGSFKTYSEADRLKAQLAMLGVEAKIEVAQIGTATWNRVKVGPFASMASADKTRSLLRQNNMDSVVQKSAISVSTQAPQQPAPINPP